jgi:transcriptional regulator with XRE-family HTH domain
LLLHRFLRPLVPLRFVWKRPKGYVAEPKTLGEHLLKRRMELGLTQCQVSTRLLTDETTIGHWEKDQTTPPVRFYPAIFAFLGYDPFPKPTTLPEQLLSKRRALGLSIKRAAKKIGVDEGTFSRWERGDWKPQKSGDTVRKFLAL